MVKAGSLASAGSQNSQHQVIDRSSEMAPELADEDGTEPLIQQLMSSIQHPRTIPITRWNFPK
jgi:hypothetical protein